MGMLPGSGLKSPRLRARLEFCVQGWGRGQKHTRNWTAGVLVFVSVGFPIFSPICPHARGPRYNVDDLPMEKLHLERALDDDSAARGVTGHRPWAQEIPERVSGPFAVFCVSRLVG